VSPTEYLLSYNFLKVVPKTQQAAVKKANKTAISKSLDELKLFY
jgi:hypothetical protein